MVVSELVDKYMRCVLLLLEFTLVGVALRLNLLRSLCCVVIQDGKDVYCVRKGKCGKNETKEKCGMDIERKEGKEGG